MVQPAADLPETPKPPLNPATKEPAKPEDFAPIFCKPIIEQEGSMERYIDIPEEVRDNMIYLNRPAPPSRGPTVSRGTSRRPPKSTTRGRT